MNNTDQYGTIVIKPHHFMDIIKLYGSGIREFVPAPDYGHDFYRIANIVVQNPEVPLRLTEDSDDICVPCKYHKEGICISTISHIPGILSKDQYNKQLDTRIQRLFKLSFSESYSAKELCDILYREKDYIFEVWCEESKENVQKRYQLFSEGARKYLNAD